MLKTKNTLSRRDFIRTSGEVALFIGVSGILPQLISCRDTGKMQEVRIDLDTHEYTESNEEDAETEDAS
mgnify:CR=1 FL=1